MPLHLLGKKSWNVYNPANIARVKADEAAAAAREAADEQRMQELDAERRAAILRGRTPPPLPEADTKKDGRVARDRDRDDRGHDRKRRRLAGEDDTDRDIRLANSAPGPKGSSEENARILKLRNSASDAPLTDHAGNINLFPVDLKEVGKREKNAEAEKEKKKKEQALEDQYTMRFSNAAGKGGLEKPWYAGERRNECLQADGSSDKRIDYPGFESKDVWGNEDPLRKEREQARIASNDPFAFMQKAQAQLKKSKEDKKRWTKERNRELNDLKATQERVDAGRRHEKRRRREDNMVSREEKHGSSKHKHRHRSRSLSRERRRSRDRRDDRDSSRRHERRHSRSRSRSRDRHRESSRRQDEKSSRRHERTNRSPNHRDSRPRYEDHVEKIVSK